MQVWQQAATVAVKPEDIMSQAANARHAAQAQIAEIWLDGSLGSHDGLPGRNTRIYIDSSMARKHTSASVPKESNSVSAESAQPAKKKRKGKAERNRLKREAAAPLAIKS